MKTALNEKKINLFIEYCTAKKNDRVQLYVNNIFADVSLKQSVLYKQSEFRDVLAFKYSE